MKRTLETMEAGGAGSSTSPPPAAEEHVDEEASDPDFYEDDFFASPDSEVSDEAETGELPATATAEAQLPRRPQQHEQQRCL